MEHQTAHLDLTQRRDVGALIGTAWTVWWHDKLLFLALSFVIIGPATFALEMLGGGFVVGATEDSFRAADAVGALFGFVWPPLVTAVHVLAVVALAQGRQPSIRGSLRGAVVLIVPLMLVAVLYTVGMTLGFLALVVPGIYLAVRWYFGPQAIAVGEVRSPVAGLSRSGALVNGHWWSTFGTLLLAGILTIAIVIPLVAVLAIPAVFTDGLATDLVLSAAVMVGQTLAASYTALIGTLLFFELRLRAGESVPTPAGDVTPSAVPVQPFTPWQGPAGASPWPTAPAPDARTGLDRLTEFGGTSS